VTISGCPKTHTKDEGYFTGFIPAPGLADMGVDKPLLSSPDVVKPAVLGKLFSESKDGKKADDAKFKAATPKDVTPESISSSKPKTSLRDASVPGITIDYRTAFSDHKLVTSVNTANVKVARGCLKRHRKLAVRGGKLTCGKKAAKKKRKKRRRKHRR
jgi:hypothetical protein